MLSNVAHGLLDIRHLFDFIIIVQLVTKPSQSPGLKVWTKDELSTPPSHHTKLFTSSRNSRKLKLGIQLNQTKLNPNLNEKGNFFKTIINLSYSIPSHIIPNKSSFKI